MGKRSVHIPPLSRQRKKTLYLTFIYTAYFPPKFLNASGLKLQV